MNDTLILGFGSDILSDEAIVARIFEKLKLQIDDVDFSLHLTLHADLLAEISQYKLIIIVDTAKSEPGKIGQVSCFTLENYQPCLHLENIHDVSLPHLIDMAEKLNIPVPKYVDIISIEIEDHLTISNQFSEIISDQLDEIYTQVERLIQTKLAVVTG